MAALRKFSLTLPVQNKLIEGPRAYKVWQIEFFRKNSEQAGWSTTQLITKKVSRSSTFNPILPHVLSETFQKIQLSLSEVEDFFVAYLVQPFPDVRRVLAAFRPTPFPEKEWSQKRVCHDCDDHLLFLCH